MLILDMNNVNIEFQNQESPNIIINFESIDYLFNKDFSSGLYKFSGNDFLFLKNNENFS